MIPRSGISSEWNIFRSFISHTKYKYFVTVSFSDSTGTTSVLAKRTTHQRNGATLRDASTTSSCLLQPITHKLHSAGRGRRLLRVTANRRRRRRKGLCAKRRLSPLYIVYWGSRVSLKVESNGLASPGVTQP